MNAAVIGMGSMGRNHFRVLREMPDVNVVAVCDPSLNGSVDVPIYTDVFDLLEKENLDFAVIAVPTIQHAEIAIPVAQRGIAILLEKPVADTVANAEHIAEEITNTGVPCAVGHIERFNPVVTALTSELSGKQIFNIAITGVGPFPPRIKDVGVLVDMAVHDADLVRHITGLNPVEIQIHKSIAISGHFEDNAVVLLHFANDTIATIATNWVTPFKRRRVEVSTDQAFYEADLVTQELVEYSSYQLDASYIVRSCKVQKGEPLARELDSFINYLKTGDRSGIATLEDGVEALRIVSSVPVTIK
jgi:UDP-N-acetylglucosamine 3-dehydrogenase